MYLYKNIKAIRTKMGMNLVQFGALFGLSSNALSYYENGKRQPPWQFIAKLEIMTGLTFREMYSGSIDSVNLPSLTKSELQRRLDLPIFGSENIPVIEEAQVVESDDVSNSRDELDNIHRLLASQARLITEIETRLSQLEEKAKVK